MSFFMKSWDEWLNLPGNSLKWSKWRCKIRPNISTSNTDLTHRIFGNILFDFNRCNSTCLFVIELYSCPNLSFGICNIRQVSSIFTFNLTALLNLGRIQLPFFQPIILLYIFGELVIVSHSKFSKIKQFLLNGSIKHIDATGRTGS